MDDQLEKKKQKIIEVARYLGRDNSQGEPCYVPHPPKTAFLKKHSISTKLANESVDFILEKLSKWSSEITTQPNQCFVVLVSFIKEGLYGKHGDIWAYGVLRARAAGERVLDRKNSKKAVRLTDLMVFQDFHDMVSSINGILESHFAFVISVKKETPLDNQEWSPNIISEFDWNNSYSDDEQRQKTCRIIRNEMRCLRSSNTDGASKYDYSEIVIPKLKELAHERIQNQLRTAIKQLTTNNVELDDKICGHLRACILKSSENSRKDFIVKTLELDLSTRP